MKTNKQQHKQTKIISTDAPPVDFSFRNIKSIEQILTLKPHQGLRKPINNDNEDNKNIPQQNKSPKEIKNLQKKNEDDAIEKPTQTKLQIVRVIQVSSFIVNQTQNNSNKQKNEPIKLPKRTQEIQLQSCSLYLSYNKLRSIKNFYNVVKQVFLDIKNLKWIDLSHNLLINLDYNFQQIKSLKTLYLHCNYIKDFNQLTKLAHLTQLKSITIHGNPLENHSHFRTILIGILPNVNRIDSTLVTKRETEVASYYFKQMNFKKLPVIPNAQKPKSEYSQGEDN